jgi:hypothetical protein
MSLGWPAGDERHRLATRLWGKAAQRYWLAITDTLAEIGEDRPAPVDAKIIGLLPGLRRNVGADVLRDAARILLIKVIGRLNFPAGGSVSGADAALSLARIGIVEEWGGRALAFRELH